MPDADDFDVEGLRKLLKGDDGSGKSPAAGALEKRPRPAIVKQEKPLPPAKRKKSPRR